ncbi:MAG TPA: sigma-70 family RNA polymerase sigma factor [Actinomycetota bacterium]|nr:sigma-70 family RNA polymerase sigma factor [Actinomycetota bacterium]
MKPPFQQVLDLHAEHVYRFLVAVGGPDAADDCFQETVVAALRAYPALRDARNLRSWLFTIAHRKVLDAARRRSREAIPVAVVPEAPTTDGGREVWSLVRALPAKQRSAVYLRYAGGLPYREIGAVLGCTDAAARRNVHEGIQKLRQAWEEES